MRKSQAAEHHLEILRLQGKTHAEHNDAQQGVDPCGFYHAEGAGEQQRQCRHHNNDGIGKVPDEESELPHALYGAKIAEKYKEKPSQQTLNRLALLAGFQSWADLHISVRLSIVFSCIMPSR